MTNPLLSYNQSLKTGGMILDTANFIGKKEAVRNSNIVSANTGTASMLTSIKSGVFDMKSTVQIKFNKPLSGIITSKNQQSSAVNFID